MLVLVGLLDKGIKVPTPQLVIYLAGFLFPKRIDGWYIQKGGYITRVLQRTISNEGRFVSKQNMVLGI